MREKQEKMNELAKGDYSDTIRKNRLFLFRFHAKKRSFLIYI